MPLIVKLLVQHQKVILSKFKTACLIFYEFLEIMVSEIYLSINCDLSCDTNT